jgi:hypothetical protein
LPFFRNEVVSDLLFSAVFFGMPAIIELVKPAAAKGLGRA